MKVSGVARRVCSAGSVESKAFSSFFGLQCHCVLPRSRSKKKSSKNGASADLSRCPKPKRDPWATEAVPAAPKAWAAHRPPDRKPAFVGACTIAVDSAYLQRNHDAATAIRDFTPMCLPRRQVQVKPLRQCIDFDDIDLNWVHANGNARHARAAQVSRHKRKPTGMSFASVLSKQEWLED